MNNIVLLILFLIFLLIIFIYINSNSIEYYTPKDNSRSIDVRLCKEESTDILTPEYDREFNLDELIKITKSNIEDDKINGEINGETNNKVDGKINGESNKKVDGKINGETNKKVDGKINGETNKKVDGETKIKTHIIDPFYHTHNLELMDNFESVKSDYSIINNIKLKENQTFVPKNYTLQI